MDSILSQMLSFSIFIIFGEIVSIPIGFLEINCLINCLILVEVVFSKLKVEFNFLFLIFCMLM